MAFRRSLVARRSVVELYTANSPYKLAKQSSVQMPCIILVSPFLAANIGAISRAMLNFGMHDLRIVNPHPSCDILSPEARTLAVSSIELLENAKIYKTFQDSINDLNRVIVTSSKVRTSGVRQASRSPRQAAEDCIRSDNMYKTGIVFGTERTGLTTEEVSYGDYRIEIPTFEEYPVLNLAQAVNIIGYECWNRRKDIEKEQSHRQWLEKKKKSNNDQQHQQTLLPAAANTTASFDAVTVGKDTQDRVSNINCNAADNNDQNDHTGGDEDGDEDDDNNRPAPRSFLDALMKRIEPSYTAVQTRDWRYGEKETHNLVKPTTVTAAALSATASPDKTNGLNSGSDSLDLSGGDHMKHIREQHELQHIRMLFQRACLNKKDIGTLHKVLDRVSGSREKRRRAAKADITAGDDTDKTMAK